MDDVTKQLRELLKEYPLPTEVPLTVPSGLLHAALERLLELEELEKDFERSLHTQLDSWLNEELQKIKK